MVSKLDMTTRWIPVRLDKKLSKDNEAGDRATARPSDVGTLVFCLNVGTMMAWNSRCNPSSSPVMVVSAS